MYSESKEKQERLWNNFLDDVEQLLPLFDNQNYTDININQDGTVIADGKNGKEYTGIHLSEEKVTAIIISAASLFNYTIDPDAEVPKVEGVLPVPYKLRFTGMLPPASSPPCIALRRPSNRIFSIEDYLKNNQMSQAQYDVICRTIKDRGNIIVSGSTGSGKTTFTNAVIKKMVEYTPDDRFYIVEDVQELVCTAKDKVMLLAPNPENAASRLVQEALRFTPDRIIFGELRYPQVTYDMLTSWNTGHFGNVTTVHANDCTSTLKRLGDMYNQAAKTNCVLEWPELLSLIVHLKRIGNMRVVDEIKKIT